MNSMQVGARVKTVLGDGTVLGFECFYPGGYRVETSRQRDSRIVVALDEPDNWSLSYDSSGKFNAHPFMSNSDIFCVLR